ncbi:MAG: hypothetical protein V8Q85_01760 [Christensenellales bacterium]
MTEWLMCAALTLTLTGYLPGISGIVLYVEAEDGTRTKLVDDVDYLTRDMYTDMLGTSAKRGLSGREWIHAEAGE